ncbi:initiation factor 2B-like protein [Nitzschia inconspicua]|uniref:Initiation factor 2B-like protein n=1 Tax=Nitzschia inconspicua TaxID=303405 RepID=A0A9K3LFP2_9STRA|nr:initiation factor 2B-like protein [Nitzschia inconspicua]
MSVPIPATNSGDVSLDSSTFSVREWLREKHPKQHAMLSQFELQLRIGRLTSANQADGRLALTLRTVEILKNMIGSTRWKSPAQLLALVRVFGKEADAAGGFREPAIGNIIRRVLAAIREEVLSGTIAPEESNYLDTSKSSSSRGRSSLESMLWSLPQHVKTVPARTGGPKDHQRRNTRSESLGSVGDIMEQQTINDYNCNLPPIFFQPARSDLKQSIMEAIQEITSELEDLHKTINDQAKNHIHSGEVILTYGKSDSVLEFLKTAADKKLRFTVIVCEGAKRNGQYEGHEMARLLAEVPTEDGNVVEDTCVIPDSAIFAMMARVNKVLLPAHAVLANGGLVSASGSNLVALAAAENAVPVVCLTGIYKLTPIFPHEGQDTLNDLLNPNSIMDYASSQQHGTVDFVNPLHDYVRPDHIKLFVTNVGSFQPSYIYRLLSEYYHQDDWAPF